jgi:hypothetical protein
MRINPLPVLLAVLLFLPVQMCSSQTSYGATPVTTTISLFGNILIIGPDEVLLPENHTFYHNATVYQEGNYDITVYLNKSDQNGFMEFVNATGQGTFYQNNYSALVQRFAMKNITLKIHVPPGQGFAGSSFGVALHGKSVSDSRTNTSNITVYVNNTNPVDNVSVLSVYPSSVYSGGTILADISVHKGQPSKITEVQACYCILNYSSPYDCTQSGRNYGCEWKAIREWGNYTKAISVNETPGEYYLIAGVSYPGSGEIKSGISQMFYIEAAPEAPPAGAPGPAFAPPPVKLPKLSIKSADYLEAKRGSGISLDVKVENTGTLESNDTNLRVYGTPDGWVSVRPLKQSIGVNLSGVYTVSIEIPEDAETGTFPLTLKASSKKAEASKDIKMLIELSPRQKAGILLGDMKDEGNATLEYVKSLENLGIDISEIWDIINVAKNALSRSESLYESGRYEDSANKSLEASESYDFAKRMLDGKIRSEYSILIGSFDPESVSSEFTGEEREAVYVSMSMADMLSARGNFQEAYEKMLEVRQIVWQAGDRMRIKAFIRTVTPLLLLLSGFVAVMLLYALFLRKIRAKALYLLILTRSPDRLLRLAIRILRLFVRAPRKKK